MNEALKSTIQALNSNLSKLSVNDQVFAKSLIKSFLQRETLSERQQYWVEVLTERALGVVETTQPKKECVGNFAGVMALFASASKTLKYPKINLQVEGKPLTLSLAGQSSKAPGTVNVTDGQKFGMNVWYGRIDAGGVWTRGNKASAEDMQAVSAFLKKFSQEPAKVASEYGRLSGRCCFCNLALSDEKSTAVGYGPVCAAK